MRLLVKLLWVFTMGCFPLMGCNDVTFEKSLLVQVSTQVDPLCDPPCPTTALEGVGVCEAGTSNCVPTDGRGKARFAPPPDKEVSYTIQKDGYEAKLFADVSDWRSEAVWRTNIRDNKRAAPWHDYLMSKYPMRGVGAVFVFLTRSFEGATFELVDATGEAFYWVEPEPPPVFPATADLNLEATTTRGAGGFLDLAPGVFQIQLGGTADHCLPGNAWPGDAKNSFRFPIRAGHVTELWVDCPVPQFPTNTGADNVGSDRN